MVMGFRLTENFEAPYFAKSVAEFWRRWHISLSGWFRDYLYIPLGGNRKGTLRKYLNLMLVFLASGLWHGAAWNYVVWGGLNGAYQVAGGCLRAWREKWNWSRKKGLKDGHPVITFILIDFSWIFFRADNVQSAFENIGSILTMRNFDILTNGELFTLGLNRYHFLFLLFAIFLLWTADFFRYKNVDIFTWIEERNVAVRYGIYLCLFCMVVLFGIYGVGYEASQFIYFQF